VKLLVDACISRKLFEAVRADGHDAVWVRDWKAAAPDTEVIAKAVDEARTIVTLDRDIPSLVLRSGLAAPSVLRLTRLPTAAQTLAAIEALRTHAADFDRGALVTASPRTVRVRRLAAISRE